jgi:hypothetical protein
MAFNEFSAFVNGKKDAEATAGWEGAVVFPSIPEEVDF